MRETRSAGATVHDVSVTRVYHAEPVQQSGGDNRGNTALQKAALKGNVHMLQILLDLGADIYHSDEDGYTPLAA